MNCSTFREAHGLFLDDMLGERDIVVMHCHLAECGSCAAFDARIRRGLLLLRNLPTIAPSADFTERLKARLHQERRAAARAAAVAPSVASRGPGIGVFTAAAVGVAAIGYLAAVTLPRHGALQPLALPPVVATRVAEPAWTVADAVNDAMVEAGSAVSSPALMASVSAGMPIWPTALLVEQAPLRFASSEFQLTSYGR